MRYSVFLLLVSVGIGLAMIELGARAFHTYAEVMLEKGWLITPSSAGSHLGPYEIDVPEIGMHWRLKPGYRPPEPQQQSGISSATGADDGTNTRFGNALVNINQDGFRGPELKSDNSLYRILMLGDSVTFGGKQLTYPTVVQRTLSARSKNVEVINAGVEGYSTRNLLLELNKYRELSPDLVTVLIGWNDIFSWRTLGNEYEFYFRSLWLARLGWKAITLSLAGAEETAHSMLRRELMYSNGAIDDASLNHAAEIYREKLVELISELESSGADIVLFTLPGLFEKDRAPSPDALKIGHLPDYTTNTNKLANMSYRFNQQIRELAGAHGITVIDLEQWGFDNLSPPANYFKDSVHLKRNGLQRLGEFIAQSIDDKFSLPN